MLNEVLTTCEKYLLMKKLIKTARNKLSYKFKHDKGHLSTVP